MVWWALISGELIEAMYEDASTKVRMNGREKERESRAFNDKVGCTRTRFSSPLLFIIVLEALSIEFREGYLRKSAIMQMILS